MTTEQDWRMTLMKKYKKLFYYKGHPTCMFGIAVGDGWRTLVESLCEYLQWNIDHNKDPQVIVTTVKEKFAGLRFYIGPGVARQFDAISFAETLSSHICEHCGAWVEKSEQDPKAPYKLTLCAKCEVKRAKAEKKRMEELRCLTKKRKARTRSR